MKRLSLLLPVLLYGLLAAPALGATFPHRTLEVTGGLAGLPLEGPISEAVISGNGEAVALTTAASNLAPGDANGRIADVMRVDRRSGRRLILSLGPGGVAANGGSRAPALSQNGLVAAFVSDASNLVADDTNGLADVFVRRADGSVTRASVGVGVGGAEPNGPSGQPDLSADGRLVAFSSAASNLVPGDTNNAPDVFVHDVLLGTTRRISVASGGGQSDGRSTAPAISADGAAVAFESAATNLVARDTNRVADVFVHVLLGTRTERVSVSTKERQQNKGITAPFTAAPDISGDGRYVVFDTDATSLYALDKNRRTDVYLRDRRRGTTTLVSASSLNVQGNNDTITPRITPNGRFITFQSFASNLVPFDGPREDLFIRDRRSGTTALINATDTGERREREPGGGQFLQRAAVTDDGRAGIFLSAASNITDTATAAPRRLFVRLLGAPRVTFRGSISRRFGKLRVQLGSDDPAVQRYLCRIDRARPFYCGPGLALPRTLGRRLTIRAGGPGMLWSAVRAVSLATG